VSRLTKAELAWHETYSKGDWTCRDCGKVDRHYYVQPQRPKDGGPPEYALCADCITAINRKMALARKAELDAMDRCQASGCNRRGNWEVGSYDRALLCGHHLKVAKRAQYKRQESLGGMALFMGIEINGAGVLALLNEAE